MQPEVRDPLQTDLLKKCAICTSCRAVSVDGSSFCLPLTREPFSVVLDKWSLLGDEGTRSIVEELKNATELLLCDSCVDLVKNIEQVDVIKREFLGLLWRRLKKSNDLRRVEDVEAGSLEDSGQASGSTAGAIRVVEGAESKPGVKQEPEVGCASSTDTIEKRSLPVAASVFGNIIIQRRQPARKSTRPIPARVMPPKGNRSKSTSKENDAGKSAIVLGRDVEVLLSEPFKEECEGKRENCNVGSTSKAFSSGENPIESTELKRKRGRPKGRTKNRKDNIPNERRKKTLICPICGMMLKGENHMLKKHIRVVHTKEKTVKCKFCPETFVYYKGLYAHQAKAHNYRVEKQSTQCEICGKVISEKWIMNDHLLVIHGITPKTGNRPVRECDKCGRKFLCKDKFEDHMNMHNNVRPYGCPLCGIRMVKFPNLHAHVKKVHDKVVRIKRDAVDGLGCELVP